MIYMITICKKPGIKDCVRITTEEDIPERLRNVIKIHGGKIILDCLEGEQEVPLGSVIAFEELTDEMMKKHNRKEKMNVWHKANWATTTIEKNGVFYEIPQPVKAFILDDSLPLKIVEELGDDLKYVNGEYQLQTKRGVSKAAEKDGYLIIYGIKDGKLSTNILTVGTPSFANYYVVTEERKLGDSLQEYHEKHVQKNKR